MTDNGTLTPAQRRAVTLLLTERHLQTVAQRAGIGERTLHRWLAQPHFQAALRDAQAQVLAGVVSRLTTVADEAVSVLREVMNDRQNSPGARVQAASVVLSKLVDLRELHELEARLSKLEALLTKEAR